MQIQTLFVCVKGKMENYTLNMNTMQKKIQYVCWTRRGKTIGLDVDNAFLNQNPPFLNVFFHKDTNTILYLYLLIVLINLAN